MIEGATQVQSYGVAGLEVTKLISDNECQCANSSLEILFGRDSDSICRRLIVNNVTAPG